MLVAAMLASVLATLGTPNRAAAAVTDHHPATYNMQGGGAKWSTDIPQLIRDGYDVISLQEAGPNPPGRLNWVSRDLVVTAHHPGWAVREYRWRPPGQTVDWYIYYVRTDPSGTAGATGGRVNLAILTRSYPSAVHVIEPAFYNATTGAPQSRPALGITLGNTQFYTVHAMSGGGNDGRRLLATIADHAGTHPWAAMGDWNREPGRLTIRRGWHRYTAGTSTHQSGGELDYMVSNERIAGYGGALHAMASDHYAVGFHHLAANAGVQLLNAHDGNRAIQFANDVSGTFLVVGSSKAGKFGHWKFEPRGNGYYRLRNTAVDNCWLDSGNGRITQWPCMDSRSDELFDVNYWADTGQIKIRPANRSTCLGDDPTFGWGSQIITTMNCNSGEARLNFRFDYDPGPNAPLVVF